VIKEATASTFVFREDPGGVWRTALVWHPRLESWMPSGGHVERDESAAEAALREVREETGLEVRLLPGPGRGRAGGLPARDGMRALVGRGDTGASRQPHARAACPPRSRFPRSRGGRRPGRGTRARDTVVLGTGDRPGWRHLGGLPAAGRGPVPARDADSGGAHLGAASWERGSCIRSGVRPWAGCRRLIRSRRGARLWPALSPVR